MESNFLFKSNEWSLFNVADYLTEWEKWHLDLIEKFSTSQLYVIIQKSANPNHGSLQNGTLMCANFLGIDLKEVEVDRHEIDASGLNYEMNLKLPNQSLVAVKETYGRIRNLIIEKFQTDQFSKGASNMVSKTTKNSPTSHFFNQTSCEWNFLSWLMPPGPRVGLCSKPGTFHNFVLFSFIVVDSKIIYSDSNLNSPPFQKNN